MTEAERKARFERSEKAYWAGEWCGECAFEHEEDPRCCYPLAEHENRSL